MDTTYRYGRRPGRRRRTRVLIVISISVLIIATVAGFIGYDLYKHRNKPVSSTGRTVVQALDEGIDKLSVDETTFSLELPSDWKEIARTNDPFEHSISWQATKTHESNRFLKLYIDIIPTTKAINRLLPVSVLGTSLTIGEVSDNCATFTEGGTLNAAQAQKLSDKPAKSQNVDFICNLSQVTRNEVGTASKDGVNTVTVTGTNKGTHKYFFLYDDHNIQPNYSILYNAVRSFKAK